MLGIHVEVSLVLRGEFSKWVKWPVGFFLRFLSSDFALAEFERVGDTQSDT